MPILERPKEPRRVRLPAREALVAARTEVLVVGGGPAGLGAAIGAARAGAKVILAERHGFLGGNATAALVMPLMSYCTDDGRGSAPEQADLLMPDDHGEGDPVIAGVLSDLLARMRLMRGARGPCPKTGYTVPFDPEVMKCAALDLLEEAGVSLLLHALATDVIEPPSAIGGSSRAGGVVFETKSGPLVVEAGTIIDCTGDGDIAAFVGADFELGREEDGLVQPISLMFRLLGFEEEIFSAWAEENPGEWRGVHGLRGLIREAASRGELNLSREDLLLFAGMNEGEVVVNGTRVGGGLGVDVFDLTLAELSARRQMREIVSFLRRRVPGFANSRLLQSAGSVGVRETRRIIGDYRLEASDLLSARRFEDAIARCSYPMDIHDPTGAGTRLSRLPTDEWYEIPLRCLLPRGIDGLIVAGRCISGSHEAHSSYRIMPVSMATGQAAGVCAAMAANGSVLPRLVSHVRVQAELRRQGAMVETADSPGSACPGCSHCQVA